MDQAQHYALTLHYLLIMLNGIYLATTEHFILKFYVLEARRIKVSLTRWMDDWARASPDLQLCSSVPSLQWSVSVNRDEALTGSQAATAHWCRWGSEAGPGGPDKSLKKSTFICQHFHMSAYLLDDRRYFILILLPVIYLLYVAHMNLGGHHENLYDPTE